MANEKLFDLAAWQNAVVQESMSAQAIVMAIRLVYLATDGVLQSHSRQQIADSIKADVRAVDRVVRTLEALGYLVIERKGGRGYTNRYEFKLPEGALGTPHEQSSAQKGQAAPADGPSQRSKSAAEFAAIAYLARHGTVIETSTIRGVEFGDRDLDQTVLTALQPALDALLGTNGDKISRRFPAGYRQALAVMQAVGLLGEHDLAAARDLARELRVSETDSTGNTV